MPCLPRGARGAIRSYLLCQIANASAAAGRSYSTNFPGVENPISEGGLWLNGLTDGLDWTNVRSFGGFASAFQAHDFNDSTALLKGTWANNQMATATVFRGALDETHFPEVELRLRSSLSPHVCNGYEFLYSLKSDASCYVNIVRWNGAVNDFTGLLGPGGSGLTGTQYVLHTGDVLKATAVGNVLSIFLNGTLLGSVSDATFPNGKPGVGFDSSLSTYDYSTFGLSQFAAAEIV
jgi:hypothetical protein